MKIQIELVSTYRAKITIDGRQMIYGYRDGVFTWIEGMKADEQETTIGGIVASKLTSSLVDIMQGHIPEEESPDGDCWETWEKLSDSVADQVYDAISP